MKQDETASSRISRQRFACMALPAPFLGFASGIELAEEPKYASKET